MFCKIFALFAVLAVAFAAPKPEPQVLTYTAGFDYPVYQGVPSVVAPSVYSSPLSPLAPVAPLAYSGYPYAANTVFVK